MVGESPTSVATSAASVDRAEIERRLALPRFTYVGESEGQGTAKAHGALAFIDSETDTLAFRPRMGDALGRVAVAPDGRLVYAPTRTRRWCGWSMPRLTRRYAASVCPG